MIKKCLTLFSVLLTVALNSGAQTINPDVLSSGGGSASSGGIQLDWVLGQPVNSTGTNAKAYLTQGFLQPELQVWTGTVTMPQWGTCQVRVPYTVSGIIDPKNVFTAELSDANGNFANPIVLGTATGNTNGVIDGVIPTSIVEGAGYRIRVRSTLPAFIGVANESDLRIRKPFIPDAFAYNYGVRPNTIYTGWAQAASLTLKADANGATNPSFVWRNSKGKQMGTGAQLSVTTADTYTVTVSASGCVATASKTIALMDVTCGTKQAPKVVICQKTGTAFQTACVLPTAVAFYLQTGSQLGVCNPSNSVATLTSTKKEPEPRSVVSGRFGITAYPNPTTTYFNVQLQSDNAREKIMVRVLDLNGKLVDIFNNASAQQVLHFGDHYVPGLYIVEMIQGAARTQIKLIKQAK